MKYLEIFCSKILLTAILLVIQLAWFILFMVRLTRYSTLVSIILTVLSVMIVLYLINKDDHSSAYKMGWIILIMTLPLFGGLLYLTMGNKRPSRKLRKRLDRMHNELIEELVQEDAVLEAIRQQEERAAGTCQYLLSQSDYPVYGNTKVKYYPLGEQAYQDILVELEQAKHYIFLEYFIIEEGEMWNTILGILARKAAEGVDVRLIYDDVGSLLLLPKGFAKKLEQQGIKCMPFNPFVPILSLVINNRDHRKILVIDGHTAFNGGINLADEYINRKQVYGHWKDTGVRLQGDAVWNFTLMFVEMWNAFRRDKILLEHLRPHEYYQQEFESDGFVQPFGDTPLDDETVSENVYMEILNQARNYVYIFTPYLIIDNEMKAALNMAAKRGVDVRIVTPGIPDKKIVFRLTRSYYAPLLKAGVKIYEYTPGFMHAKSYVCDDEFGVVGTINMDFRSLYLHFECGTFMYRNEAVMELKADSLETIQKSRQIRIEDTSEGFFGSLFDAALRLAAPLL